MSDASSHTTTSHDEIRKWVEERGGEPAVIKGTQGGGDVGELRIMFPDAPHSDDSALEPISWEEFFKEFDQKKLALLYQSKTAEGKESRFTKLISRDDK